MEKGKGKKEQRKGKLRTPDNVFFIPYTPEGELRKQLQKQEDEMGFKLRIKYVEKLGNTVADMLVRTDPVGGHCGRDCNMCSTKTGDCTKKNVVYQIECAECTKLGKKPKYFGETARTGFERMREHLTLLNNHPDKSALGDHIRDKHSGKPTNFTMKLVSKHFKPLERQCAEAIQITEYKDGQVMNRRGEFGENLPPDFGILEDGLYRTNPKRKKVELKQQVPADKATKRVKLAESEGLESV